MSTHPPKPGMKKKLRPNRLGRFGSFIKKHSWFLSLAVTLLACSLFLYELHYLLFDDLHHILVFLLHHLAFIPIEVLLVGLVIERILARREKKMMQQKLNMVIGTFFSELGKDLVKDLASAVQNLDEAVDFLTVKGNWSDKDYRRALEFVQHFRFAVDPERLDFSALRDRLIRERDLLVLLLGNPNLLENEEFTELLWSVFHLIDELSHRSSFDDLPEPDSRHLAFDVHRVYKRLVHEWIKYCRHLQRTYPYMFAYLVRTYPLRGHIAPSSSTEPHP